MFFMKFIFDVKGLIWVLAFVLLFNSNQIPISLYASKESPGSLSNKISIQASKFFKQKLEKK